MVPLRPKITRTLTKSHILLVKYNHRYAFQVTGSAQNCLWHLLTLALDIMAILLLPAFVPCSDIDDVYYRLLR